MKPSTHAPVEAPAIKRRAFFGKLTLSLAGGLAGSSVLGKLFTPRKSKGGQTVVIARHELSVPRRKKG